MQPCGEKGQSLGRATTQTREAEQEVSRGDREGACQPGGRKVEQVWGPRATEDSARAGRKHCTMLLRD